MFYQTFETQRYQAGVDTACGQLRACDYLFYMKRLFAQIVIYYFFIAAQLDLADVKQRRFYFFRCLCRRRACMPFQLLDEAANAVRFIRQHAKKPIQVTDVVNAAALSRRPLEKRFRKVLNRSILDEIRRVRAAQVSRMLVDTNLSISQIASALGYPTVKHIARSFRSEKRLPPLAYREKYGRK